MSQDLSKAFNKFSGLEVNVTENPFEGWGHKFNRPSLAEVNPVIDELRAAATAMGIADVRIWLPESMGTMDFRPDRLNVYIEKESDGVYRVQNKFTAG